MLLPETRRSDRNRDASIDVDTVDGQALSTIGSRAPRSRRSASRGSTSRAPRCSVTLQLRDDGPFAGVADAAA